MEAFFNRMMRLGFGVMGAGVLATRFFFVVDGGERALKFDQVRGLQSKVYGEGMHFYIPILQVRNILIINFRRSPKDSRSAPVPNLFTQQQVLAICRQSNFPYVSYTDQERTS
jgi:hypothetical protein